MTTLASQLLLSALVTLVAYVAYVAWRSISHPHACQPQQPHWTLDDLVSKRAETEDEALWTDEYLTWRVAQIHGRGPYDQEADS